MHVLGTQPRISQNVQERHSAGSLSKLPDRLHNNKRLQTVNTYLSILFGSICGVLARKGLQSLTSYSGSFLEGVVWANFVACVVMGMAVESQRIWSSLINATEKHEQLYATKAAIPLYAGLTTGFCGSCSSFSSFILEAFAKGANLPPSAAYPTTGYGILSVIEVLLAHLGISVCGYRVGAHLMRAFESKMPAITTGAYRIIDMALGCLGTAAYVVVVVLVATQNEGKWRSWTFSCLFAPWGAYCRFWLAKYLNSAVKDFPLGTYTANFTGTVFLAVLTLLSKGRTSKESSLPIVSRVLTCQVLTGLENGFCGCLTTVSTFVVEIGTLRLVRSYFYGLVSVATSFLAVLLIVGSYNWTVGFTLAVC